MCVSVNSNRVARGIGSAPQHTSAHTRPNIGSPEKKTALEDSWSIPHVRLTAQGRWPFTLAFFTWITLLLASGAFAQQTATAPRTKPITTQDMKPYDEVIPGTEVK